MAIATITPATGATLKTFEEMSEAEVERCLAAATAAHASYRLTSFDDRSRWIAVRTKRTSEFGGRDANS